MEKRLFLLSAVCLTFALWACGGDDSSSAGNDPEISSSSEIEEESSSSIAEDKSSESKDEKSSSSETIEESSSSNAEDKSSASKDEKSSSSNAEDKSSESKDEKSSSSEAIEESSSSSIVEESSSSDINFVEDHRSECIIENIPTSINNAKLPNPFEGLNGKVISSKADWKCRREEIGAMYEKIMFGTKPRNPEKVEGSYSGGKFTVKVTDKGKSGSFSVTISGAGTKDNPKPAIIGFGGGLMGNSCGRLGGALSGLDVAQIIFNPDNVAPESGGGMFYTVNSGSDAGTIMAWAWGVSRLIDALETTPEAGIDVKHLAITGCSRWGKGSLAVGAFDERIALTIPQESGSGGVSLWRSIAQVNRQKGTNFVQPLGSAATEGLWMKTTFKNYDGKENMLPFDQHMLVSMVAPRAILILDNAGHEWLGEVPSNYCGQASLETFKALGITENYTYSQQGGHDHCSLPNEQFDEVKDFVDKFLLGKEAETGKIEYSQNTETINFKKSEWIDWDTPVLQ